MSGRAVREGSTWSSTSRLPRQSALRCRTLFLLPPMRYFLLQRRMSAFGTKQTCHSDLSMSASLIGRLGSSAFRLSNVAVSMSLAGSRFSSDSALRPFQHGVRRRGGTIFRSALPSAGPSRHANSPHPSSREGHHSTRRWSSSVLLSKDALDARRERIIISQSQVNWVKWSCLGLQALCALLAIAMVHSDDRLTSAITLGLFGIGVAASLLLILAYDRPFTGELAVRPNPLLQVMPELEPSKKGSNPDPVGTKRTSRGLVPMSAFGGKADIERTLMSAFDPSGHRPA